MLLRCFSEDYFMAESSALEVFQSQAEFQIRPPILQRCGFCPASCLSPTPSRDRFMGKKSTQFLEGERYAAIVVDRRMRSLSKALGFGSFRALSRARYLR